MEVRAKWRFDGRSSLLTLGIAGLALAGLRVYETQIGAARAVPVTGGVDPALIASLKAGMDGTVRNRLRGAITVGRSRDNFEKVRLAEDSNDQITARGMVGSGLAYKVTNGNGAVIMDKDPSGAILLQFTGGDHAGEIGWTSGEYFNPSGLTAQPMPGSPLNAPNSGTAIQGGP